MYSTFKYKNLPLKDILLDERNPRLVTQSKLAKQDDIVAYLYEHEGLDEFVHEIAHNGRNPGAERPYVVLDHSHYVVVEGNTRVAAYKLLTGLLAAPKGYSVPHISKATKAALETVDCTIAQNREQLMPIMAKAHFGLGDKSKWNYLGSRKAVYDEWKRGNSLTKLSKVFGLPQGEIRDLILEYQLYRKALGLPWSEKEKARLLHPAVAFNPPVRFLQTGGHKEKMGISYDTANLDVVFSGDAKKKFKHLLKKLVITPEKGLGATASYDSVFFDYPPGKKAKPGTSTSDGNKSDTKPEGGSGTGKSKKPKGTKQKANALFSYQPSITNALVSQLMKEAKDIDSLKLPASATFLLRNIVEALLKHIIDAQKANKTGSTLDLEAALNICRANHVTIPASDKKVLKQFQQDHLNYLNLGAHGSVIPNSHRVAAARDCIDQFIKKYV